MRWAKWWLGRIARIAAAVLPAALGLFVMAQAPAPERFIVVLDAGHGGDDPAGRLEDKSGKVTDEKVCTLALSERLRSLLAARGMAVVTTRAGDIAVSPDRRAEIAGQAKAQACLSLHATMSGTGVHLYTSSLAPASAGSLSSPTPWKTAQASWVEQSLKLAGVLDSALVHAGIPVIVGRTALPDIDSMACPAVALEVAPLAAADHGQENSPTDPDYQARVAEALAAALVEWRAEARKQ
jgi:N-acetylmuramoyl-L-alanine amidase